MFNCTENTVLKSWNAIPDNYSITKRVAVLIDSFVLIRYLRNEGWSHPKYLRDNGVKREYLSLILKLVKNETYQLIV